MSWISFGTQAAIAAQLITFPKKPVSVDGCTHLLPEDLTSRVEEPLLPFEVQYVYLIPFNSVCKC